MAKHTSIMSVIDRDISLNGKLKWLSSKYYLSIAASCYCFMKINSFKQIQLGSAMGKKQKHIEIWIYKSK